jgi:uncharacterized membrane protein YeaQ/YmgE (transglycosylase-associated protein family)
MMRGVHFSNERMIVILLVGAVAGYLSSKVVRGANFGVVGDACVGIVRAMIGDWLLPRFNIHFAGGLMGLAVDAAIGAIVLLLVLRSVGASGWGGARWACAGARD